ncbi:MAG: response regulator transcription factor [Cyclobacteriaceae bacterium]|nr:response regulator transcription factor [Cyclobacteriaceae bacterium SS2]
MNKIKIILVEDHPMVRIGLKSLLSGSDHIDIIGEASNGVEAVDLIEKDPPEIVVSDISMPQMNGLALAKHIQENHPDIKVLLLTIHMEPEYIIEGFDAGIMGYLPKDSSQEELIEAIETIYTGGKYMSQKVSEIIAQRLIRKDPFHKPNTKLTPREKKILEMLVEGDRNKEIAEKLSISVRTVDTHRTNIMRKLDVNNTAELVKKAISDNLI